MHHCPPLPRARGLKHVRKDIRQCGSGGQALHTHLSAPLHPWPRRSEGQSTVCSRFTPRFAFPSPWASFVLVLEPAKPRQTAANRSHFRPTDGWWARPFGDPCPPRPPTLEVSYGTAAISPSMDAKCEQGRTVFLILLPDWQQHVLTAIANQGVSRQMEFPRSQRVSNCLLTTFRGWGPGQSF